MLSVTATVAYVEWGQRFRPGKNPEKNIQQARITLLKKNSLYKNLSHFCFNLYPLHSISLWFYTSISFLIPLTSPLSLILSMIHKRFITQTRAHILKAVVFWSEEWISLSSKHILEGQNLSMTKQHMKALSYHFFPRILYSTFPHSFIHFIFPHSLTFSHSAFSCFVWFCITSCPSLNFFTKLVEIKVRTLKQKRIGLC